MTMCAIKDFPVCLFIFVINYTFDVITGEN